MTGSHILTLSSINSVMAAGRGQFFQSVVEGLERIPAQSTPGRRQPGRGRGKPGPGKAPAGGKRKKRQPQAAPGSFSGNDLR